MHTNKSLDLTAFDFKLKLLRVTDKIKLDMKKTNMKTRIPGKPVFLFHKPFTPMEKRQHIMEFLTCKPAKIVNLDSFITLHKI